MRVTLGRRVASAGDLKDPGDYAGPFEELEGLNATPSGREAVWFVPPSPATGLRRVTSPPWEFTEQEDGSLEIREG